MKRIKNIPKIYHKKGTGSMGKLSKQQELSLEIHTKIRFFWGKRIIIIKKCVYLHTNYQLTPNNYEEISRLYAARLHRVWLGNNDDTIVVKAIQYRKRTAKRRHIPTIDGRRACDNARLLDS